MTTRLQASGLIALAGTFCNLALLKPLPAANVAIVNEALNGAGDNNVVVARRPGCYVTRRELRNYPTPTFLVGIGC